MKTHVLDDDSKSGKLTNGSSENKLSAVKAIDSVVFDSFKGLTSVEEADRVKAGLQLLQHLARTQNVDKREKEIDYIVKRLVRGVGASTTTSRAGFFTTLVGFLQAVRDKELTVKTVSSVASKQLHVGKTISSKEDADAVVGQILTCGALIRSNKILRGSQKEIQKVCQTLINSSKHRTYHHALAYSFLVELLEKLSEEQFTEIVWPLLSIELTSSWEQQTIHSLHCLIVATTKFPDTFTSKYMKTTFGGPSLLNARSANQLFKLFWENTSAPAITHPAFEAFGTYIAKSKYLETFWLTEVDGSLKSPAKLREIGTLKILSDILTNADPASFKVSTLLTENFVTMMVDSLKKIKFKKEETLKAFYDAFLEALFKWSGKLPDDAERVAIIKRLILHPGNVNIEKLTSQRIVHQIVSNLKEDGVKEIFEVYKNIFLAKTEKTTNRSTDASWMNAERQCAGYMLQDLVGHKNIQMAFEWRKEQLKFFMTIGLFHTNDGMNLISKKDDNETINADLASQMKSVFYASLQCKLPRLQEERGILLSLVERCNEILGKKNPNKYLRNPLDEKVLKAWHEMHAEVTKHGDIENKLKLVFNMLLLHMGLQLFHEPEMAENAIWDLEKCMAKTSQPTGGKKKSKKKKPDAEADAGDEPEWIEVVIDLFLHLLSQNTSTLRNVVNAMFPYLCDSLSLSAVHQILSVLDMQDGKNPLSGKADDEPMENDDEDKADSESDKSDDDESDNEDSDDDDEDEELVEEEEEENTHTDLLRNAVSQALIGDRRHDDQDSVDLNDMDEEEGQRLDETLSSIFKNMIKPKQYKKTKGYRIETTSNMHFRIRVLDLIEIYIQHKPSLLVTVEIMTSLYNMIEFCTDGELKPLANKVEKVLQKLTALRHFTSVEDISEKNIADYLRIVIEKKVNAPALDVLNKVKSKCCVFLISSTKLLSANGESNVVVNLLEEYLDDFIKSRNPAITTTLLSEVFRMRWSPVWQLSTNLVRKGLASTTRTFRRIQVCELLSVIYNNHELIRQEQKVAKKSLKVIEAQIQSLAEHLTKADNVSTREFNALVNVLFLAHRCHAKTEIANTFENDSLCKNIQEIRQKIKLDDGKSYSRFCSTFGVKMIRNSEIKVQGQMNGNGHSNLPQNGDVSMESDEESDAADEDEGDKKENGKKKGKPATENGGAKKRKADKKTTDKRKEKRLKKEERMRAMSKGLEADGSE